jgi:hypothetical protein
MLQYILLNCKKHKSSPASEIARKLLNQSHEII